MIRFIHRKYVSLLPFLLWLGAMMIIGFIPSHAQAPSKKPQKKVQFYGSDYLYYDASEIKAKRYIGNVHCEYEGTHFYCDSLYQYDNDDFDAFSNIRIVKGNAFTLTGEKLHFDNLSKTAQVRNNVVLRDREMTLTTNSLDYKLETEIGNYQGGGTIVSNTNSNKLTSEIGYYHSKIQTFYFRKNVVLTNTDYKVRSDTMQYNSATEVTYFYGPTRITGENLSIYCESGYYNTKTDLSRFGKNTIIQFQKNELRGDSVYYDGKKEIGEAFHRVSIRDTTAQYLITGNYGHHNEKLKRSLITQNAQFIQYFEKDTLHLHADTLRSVADTSGKENLYAYHHVKFFKNDLQGKCDSLNYAQKDSTLQMVGSPVIWNHFNQISGDTILITITQGHIQQFLVHQNAFLLSDAMASDSSQASSAYFNQIKGRDMTGYFQEDELHALYVAGNGQLIYFPKEENPNSAPKAVGLNKGECSNIWITIRNNELTRLRMETDTNSKFSPIQLTQEAQKQLDGFQSRFNERPTCVADIFLP